MTCLKPFILIATDVTTVQMQTRNSLVKTNLIKKGAVTQTVELKDMNTMSQF